MWCIVLVRCVVLGDGVLLNSVVRLVLAIAVVVDRGVS